ncbi:hypothetical protein [Sphingomonas soli]|uniref:hypothetical protein n=1 Tax=Sphingomonas soli TaxID=266127 RepID=UPI00082C2E6C|nr:hypothetical protein [Sphingomonas soli]
MIRFAVPLLVLATAATGAASEQKVPLSDEAKIALELKGLTPGKPQNCVRSDRITETRGFEKEILFIEGRNKVWRNTTRGTCSGLKRDDIPVFRTFGRQYCASDTVHTRSRTGGMMTGSCSLGEFVPYTESGA